MNANTRLDVLAEERVGRVIQARAVYAARREGADTYEMLLRELEAGVPELEGKREDPEVFARRPGARAYAAAER